jgi:hypothetical protein
VKPEPAVRDSVMREFFKFALKYFLSILIVLRAYTLGIFIRRYGILIDVIYDNSKIPSILGLKDLKIKRVPAGEIVKFTDNPLAFPVGEDGNITTKEVIVINHLVKTHSPARLFEIGTFNGRTTLNLALNSPPEAEVFTLDLPDGGGERDYIKFKKSVRKYKRQSKTGCLFLESEYPEANKITQLFGDSAAFDFSPYFGTIDLVFVDGSHAYEYVKNDTEVALKLLRDGKGIIIWHDYTYAFPGVIRALNEFYRNGPFDKMVHVGMTSLVFSVFD